MIGCGVAEEWDSSRRGICENRSHKGFVKSGKRFFRGTSGDSGYRAKGFVAWIEFGTQGLDMDPKGKSPIKGYTKEFKGGIERERDAQEIHQGLESGLMGICREKGLALFWIERKSP